MESHAHGHGCGRGSASVRRASVRLLSYVLLAGGLALAFPAAGLAQVTFTSEATVSYSLSGRTILSGFPEAPYTDVKTLSTNNTEPVQLSKTIGGTLGSGGASATLSTNATATASAGVMRAAIDGFTNATWTNNAEQSIAELRPSSVTVSWIDAYILLGDPANPQPGRPLQVQALLNLSGSLGFSLTDPALEFGEFPASSFAKVSVSVSGQDHLGRGLIVGDASGLMQGATRPGILDTIHDQPPLVMPITIQALEGHVSSMRFVMHLTANAASATGSQFFGADSTATTFNADFAHTLSWGGITSVTDVATGAPVSGWTITSASGVDYATAVPEPASAATLLALAAPALLARRSLRRRRGF